MNWELPDAALPVVCVLKMTNAPDKGMLSKIKPYAFTLFVKRYGEEALLDCLARNEEKGIVYHREGFSGDYDDFDDAEELISFIQTGTR